MKGKCEIVRDLLPIYIENLESEETKNYIEEHLKDCAECKEILNNMKSDYIKEEQENLDEKQVEVRSIKKFKQRVNLLKFSAIASIITVLIILFSIIILIFPKYVVIYKSNEKLKDFRNMNNYKVTLEEHYTEHKTQEENVYTSIRSFNGEKYKEEFYTSDLLTNNIVYGDFSTNTSIYIDKIHQTVTLNNNVNNEKGGISNLFTIIQEWKKRPLNLITYELREDSFKGKECYVLKFGDASNFSEIWIDKETMFEVRELQEAGDLFTTERIFSIEQNIVTDEEVEIPNLEGYEKTN